MQYRIAYYFITLLLTGIACYVLLKIKNNSNTKNKKFRKNRYEEFKELVKFKGDEKEFNKLFSTAGLNITIGQYQSIRYFLFILWILMIFAASKFNIGKLPLMQLLTVVIVYYATTPKISIMGKKTPFRYMIDALTIEYRNKVNIEIYRIFSQLKNMTMNRKDNPPGATFMFEQLKKFTKVIRPALNRFITLYNEDKLDEAHRYLQNALNTHAGHDLADLLIKLDKINPQELKNQLSVYQEKVRLERETASKKKNENRSNIIYFIVMLSLFIIVMNFIVVVFYLDSLSLMKYLF